LCYYSPGIKGWGGLVQQERSGSKKGAAAEGISSSSRAMKEETAFPCSGEEEFLRPLDRPYFPFPILEVSYHGEFDNFTCK
jgi:hypothetical protein